MGVLFLRLEGGGGDFIFSVGGEGFDRGFRKKSYDGGSPPYPFPFPPLWETFIYIYMYIYIYVCVCVCVCVLNIKPDGNSLIL